MTTADGARRLFGNGAVLAALFLFAPAAHGGAAAVPPVTRVPPAGPVGPLRVAIHVDTSVSHGGRTIRVLGIPVKTVPGEHPQDIEHIAEVAKEQGIDAIVLADRATAEFSYGLTRFSRLLRVTVSQGSVRQYGARRYSDRLDEVEYDTGVVLIPGVECVPHYRWRGDPFGALRLEHAYEHLVVAAAGVDGEALRTLPDPANGHGVRFSWTVLWNVPLVLLVAVGMWLWGKRARLKKAAGAVCIISGMLALVDGAPFLPREVSPYAEPTVDPADVLAEHAEAYGGLAVWAHPDATPGSLPHRVRAETGIDVAVGPYPERLVESKAYHAFAMFNAGVDPGRPGREWDAALAAYCAGRRPRPVWAVSECDYDADSPPDGISDAQTVVWAARDAYSIVDALREGRCYATFQDFHKKIRVTCYELYADTGARAYDGIPVPIGAFSSGETLDSAAERFRLVLALEMDSPTAAMRRLRVRAVVNGAARTLDAWKVDGRKVRFDAPIDVPGAKKMSYVRVLVCDNDQPVLALNPIFIRRP
jgi:hypothetical protein